MLVRVLRSYARPARLRTQHVGMRVRVLRSCARPVWLHVQRAGVHPTWLPAARADEARAAGCLGLRYIP